MYCDIFEFYSSFILYFETKCDAINITVITLISIIRYTQERASTCNCRWMHARFPACPTRNRTDRGYPVVRSHAYN